MRIALLNNLRAGSSGAQVSRMLEYLVHHPEVIHVETDRAGVVPDAIDSIADQEVDLLIVNGGDGTLQYALTEILTNEAFESPPMVSPLCGGRTNMTASDFGCAVGPLLAWTVYHFIPSPTLTLAIACCIYAVGALVAYVRMRRG